MKRLPTSRPSSSIARRSHRLTRGTTLVEVMAAAAMSVLLLGALVLAMQTMHRQEAFILAADHGHVRWKRELQDTLEWDFINSRQWNHRFSALRLVGFTGKAASGHAQHSPQEVRYRFLPVGDDVWLVRESLPMTLQAGGPAHEGGVMERTLLCRGVSNILIGRPEDDLRSLLAPRGEFDNLFPIPNRIHCVLVDANDQPVLDFICLRSGGGS